MSGAAGHLSHLYEDPTLTFEEIKGILTLASQGKLEQVSEKLDGRNIVFSWDSQSNELRVARAAGDISRGGMNAIELAKKFQGRENLEDAFNSAFKILNLAISSLSKKEREVAFGKSSNKWYSAEVIYAASPNVIQYDSNSIVFHAYPIYEVSNDGKISQSNDNSGISTITSNIQKMQKTIENEDWTIHGPAIVKMKALTDGSILKEVLQKISSAMSAAGVSNEDTVQKYIENKTKTYLENQGFTGNLLSSVLLRILKKPGAPDLRTLKKMFPAASKKIDDVVKNDEKIIKNTLLELDTAINDFAVKILETLESSFILDNEKEVSRLRAATEAAINALQGSGEKSDIEFLQKQLKRLGSTKNIKSAVEGVVFTYDNKTYKFTGAFAAANQILGFYRYRKPKKLDESSLRSLIRNILIS
jgi:hypothetical protein